jgi:YihY family inner membrane protein
MASKTQPSPLEQRIERAIAGIYAWLARNRVTRTPWAVIQTFSAAQGSLLSGSMAYYTFLSLLPLLMVAGFVLGTISQGSETIQDALAAGVDQIFPGLEGEELLEQLIRARVAFGVFGLITVAYAGSGFVGALTASLNRMWGVPTGRNPLGQKLVNIGVVVLFGAVLLGSAGITIWVGVQARASLGENGGRLDDLLEVVAAPIALFLVLLLMYRLLPNRSLDWRSQLPGAILGAVGIELLKRAFAFWADRSASIAALPRSLLSVVLLLVWLGFFSQLILYGAALNVVRARKRTEGSGHPDSSLTVAPGNRPPAGSSSVER